LVDMKKLFFLLLVTILSVWASAQKVYFLYLQSDDQSPFYVKMNNKIHSSAASGFLIIPNLTDSTYTFGLGFAKSQTPEVNFSVSINENDKGYIIKNFQEGLSLFDIQDLSLVKSNASPEDNTVYQTKSDNFSSILSKAAADPSLLKVPVAKKETPVKVGETEKVVVAKTNSEPTANTIVIIDSADKQNEAMPVTVQQPAVIQENKTTTEIAKKEAEQVPSPIQKTETKEEPPVTQLVNYKPSVVSRHAESSTTEGFGLVYFDKRENGVDTVRILIPPTKVKLISANDTTVAENVLLDRETATVAAVAKQEEAKENTDTQPAKTVKEDAACKSVASDKDFMKLRKKMAAEESDDAMLDEARKGFRNKCYSVEQVRYLSSLFLTPASKYQFFDAAFAHVTDKTNFASLGAEIKDDHYMKRFKALIGE
jgi:hypothetical protein